MLAVDNPFAQLEPKKRKHPISIVNLSLFAVACGLAVLVVLKVRQDYLVRANLVECKSNLRSISVATELFRTRRGHYPSEVDDLSPEFLKEIPRSPGGATSHYKLGPGPRVTQNGKVKPTYLISCTDPLHLRYGGRGNYWAYDSESGFSDLNHIEQ